MVRLPSFAPRGALLRDGLLGAALALLAFVPPLAGAGTRLGELPHRPLDALAVAAVLAQTLSLTVRRRRPAACLALVAGGFAVQELRGYATFAGAGLLVALYSAAAHQPGHRRALAAAATAGYAGLAAGLHAEGSSTRLQDFVIFFLFLAGCWFAGAWMRGARAAEAERRRALDAAARVQERARIARELHDVITHHVTAMVVQADAAQYLAAAPDRLAGSLTAISGTGRRALGELRDLLGVLDPDRLAPDGDRPALGSVGDLVAQTRAAGQPVDLVEEGHPRDLGSGRELAAYRVVQEALTNAMKYAAGRPTVVRVVHRPDGVHIDVTTAAGIGSTRGAGGAGRGLAGLRDRVEVFGGELTAGPAADGGFTVAARIPAGEPA
ncbi:sensor histidine kinase [Dactylosporangium sp. CA-139066]|uniref:sensor histidine kinase n=1 Tax=Dactylosporangium sp. CA-139066 TaxID=3239930 RepID=UPI003D8B3ED4